MHQKIYTNMNYTKLILLQLIIFLSIIATAQNKVTSKIMELGKTDNRTMQHLDVLSNRLGPRPIGSDAYENATYWVADQLRKWGLDVEIQKVGELPVGGLPVAE